MLAASLQSLHADKSPLWTEHFKREVAFTDNPGDGLFYMAYEDFVKFFSGINVCRPFAGSITRPWWCNCDGAAESPRKGVAAKRWTEHRQKGRFYFTDRQLQVAPYSIAVPKATKARVWCSAVAV